MARPRVAAGALIFDEEGRVLLVKPTYKDGWEIPGGYVEPGETPLQACVREVKEELGLDRTLARLLVVDWAPSDTEGDKLLFVFDGGMLPLSMMRSIVLPDSELSTFAFHEVEALRERMVDRLARRVLAAVRAKQDGRSAYLEHGIPRSVEDP